MEKLPDWKEAFSEPFVKTDDDYFCSYALALQSTGELLPRIDLLDTLPLKIINEETRKNKNKKMIQRLFYLNAFLTIFGFFVLSGYIGFSIAGSHYVKVNNAVIQSLDKQEAQDRIQEQRLKENEKLLKMRSRAYQDLVYISCSVPDGVVLNKLVVNKAGRQDSFIALDGSAISQIAVQNSIDQLARNNRAHKQVKLLGLERTETPLLPIRYQIEIQ